MHQELVHHSRWAAFLQEVESSLCFDARGGGFESTPYQNIVVSQAAGVAVGV